VKTIFLVTTGSYSDYQVRSAWSTRELAEAQRQRMIDEYNARRSTTNPDDIDIDEILFDQMPDSKTKIWIVYINEKGARAQLTTDSAWGPSIPETRMWVGHDRNLQLKHGDAEIVVEAENDADAIKIAAEKRASGLAASALRESQDPGEWWVLR
jgi:hypothetical protein